AVGIGGPIIGIYSISSPGGYQLLGRTIFIYDQQRRNRVFKENPVLLQLADRIKFSQVTDEQIEEIRRKIVEDTYRYRITNYELFSVRKYVEFLNSVENESKEFLEKQEQARKSVSAP
ncbi:MAG: carboxyltransferase domain-containing protein, partial [Candidatus Bathyarchaeia archaeon]